MFDYLSGPFSYEVGTASDMKCSKFWELAHTSKAPMGTHTLQFAARQLFRKLNLIQNRFSFMIWMIDFGKKLPFLFLTSCGRTKTYNVIYHTKLFSDNGVKYYWWRKALRKCYRGLQVVQEAEDILQGIYIFCDILPSPKR